MDVGEGCSFRRKLVELVNSAGRFIVCPPSAGGVTGLDFETATRTSSVPCAPRITAYASMISEKYCWAALRFPLFAVACLNCIRSYVTTRGKSPSAIFPLNAALSSSASVLS